MVRFQVTTLMIMRLKFGTVNCNFCGKLKSDGKLKSETLRITKSRILWYEFYGTEFQFTIGFLVFPDFNLPDSKFKSRTEIRPRGRR